LINLAAQKQKKNLIHIHRDLWYGYQVERQKLLELVKEHKNVVFLSGDRHQVLVTEMEGYGAYEFSASPFSQ
jgi:phosphodiesterase/alkaline phosphatase D-like protein